MAERGGQFPKEVQLDTVSLSPGDYVFTDGQEPPRYAYIHTSEHEGEIAVSAAGPFSREHLDFEFGGGWEAEGEPSPQVVARREALLQTRPYSVTGFDFVGVEGSYPGGRERMIRNAAQFVLGIE